MVNITLKILVLLKNNFNYLENNASNASLKSIIDFYFVYKNKFLHSI